MDITGGGGSSEHTRKRRAAATAEGEDGKEEGVIPADVVEGIKHGDGSIYRPNAYLLHELYHLDDPRETRLEPMRLTSPTDRCYPRGTPCRQHIGCSMMQIFSLKLSKPPRGAAAANGQIQLYGFMAVRDLLDPLRNYVFNYSRDDPFIIHDLHSDPFVYLSGPRRGIYLDCQVLVEYDIRIKRGQTTGQEDDDLPFIDGVATFSEFSYKHGVTTDRISGDCGGSMDIARSLFRSSVEATVQVRTSEIGGNDVSGLDLFIAGFVSKIPEEIKVFRGTIGDLRVGKRFVVAVRLNSTLRLHFKVPALGPDPFIFAFWAVAHGCISYHQEHKSKSYAVDVHVTWSSLY